MDPRKQQLIDSYLRNELSEADRASFESMMESDPAFTEEVRFEQHVKEGISQYRKAELKARLDAIEVSPGWLGIGELGSSTLVKTIGGIITAGILGTAGYFLLDTDKETTVSKTETSFEEVVSAFPKENEIPDLIIPEADKEVNMVVDDEPALDRSFRKPSLTAAEPVVTEKENSISKDQPAEEEFVPHVDVPGLNEVESEEPFTSTSVDMPEASATDEINSGSVPLDIKAISRNSDQIKYKYFDGKLYLFGDFKKQPYEILEINSISERRIYVYHNSSYYTVNVTDQVEELPQITNEKLIRELEILRNNKLKE